MPRRLLLCLGLLAAAALTAGPAWASPPPPRSPEAAARTIWFAGIPWGVRDTPGGPGPNEWSSSGDSVWTDSAGRLHLKIKKYGSQWYAAEVFSIYPAQYGPHRFTVEKASPTLDQIDPNLVLGMFLYKSGCGDPCSSELDIEISRWQDPSAAYNAQYVAQPYTRPGNLYPFTLPQFGSQSIHSIDWQPTRAIFSSHAGTGPLNPAAELASWSYSGSNIPRQSENVRVIIDYWMYRGKPPANGLEDEIIISDADIAGICRPAPEPLTCGSTVSGVTTAAGSRSQISDYDVTGWLETGRETAFTFTPAETGPVSLALSSEADLDIFVLADQAGVCSAENAIAYGNAVTSFTAQAGVRYYVVVDGFLGSAGSYTLSADCSGAQPPADPPKLIWRLSMPLIAR